MSDVFVKKHWDEDDIIFYIHFQNDYAVKQIEISSAGKIFLSSTNPIIGDSMLCDKEFGSFDFNDNDFIAKQDFELKWNPPIK